MAKLVVLILGITLILAAVACGGGSSPSTDSKSSSQKATGDSGKNVAVATSKPSPTSKPASKQESATTKADWVTFTDLDKIFSVTVPSNWTAAMDDDLRSLDFFETFYNQGILPVFFGIDENSGSNLFILADFQALLTEEPLPIDGKAYADVQQSSLEVQPNYRGGMSSSGIVVDGIQTTELRYDMAEGVKQIAYVMNSNEPRMGCGSLGILLTGTIASDADAPIIEKAMASVKILPTAALSDDCDDRRALSALDLFPNVTTDSASVAQDGVIEVDGLMLLEWEPIEDQMGDLAVVGVIENTSDELKEMVYVSFDVYDKAGYSLGQIEAITERLQPGRKWKFEAVGIIDADEVGEIELFDMGTY